MELILQPFLQLYRELQFTPYAYISNKNYNSCFQRNYVIFIINTSTILLNIKPLNMDNNSIYMNNINRKLLNITVNSINKYLYYNYSIMPIDIIIFNINMIGSYKININVKELNELIKTKYNHLIIQNNVIIPIEYNNTILKLTSNNFNILNNITQLYFESTNINIILSNNMIFICNINKNTC